ncbi:YT521-B-like domain-containing protein [Hysterangium stoloniferum]|nr:YT521-B-like domain-containing protein [Hysterangium stoloniferum]
MSRTEFDLYRSSSGSVVRPQALIHIPRDSTFPPVSPLVPHHSSLNQGQAGPSALPTSSPSNPNQNFNPPASTPTPTTPSSTPHRKPTLGPVSRKSYHPAPPSNRSEWVMWVGNVPSDATHTELWSFFNQPAPSPPPPNASAILSSRLVQPTSPQRIPNERWCGVCSVFLISRSNCAFINFETEVHLVSAVAHFNGKPLRAKDPKCPRLLCRVRRRDDDLRAGVGGQRGMGIHMRWVEEQKGKERVKNNVDGPPTSPSTYLATSNSSDRSPPIPAVDKADGLPNSLRRYGEKGSDKERMDGEKPRHGSSGDRSFASTSSSFLSRHFPKRYFILKSLTQYDLNLSVDRGVWATQSHNEGVLDQAFRTSTDVFLIFSANKSGEFFGYARMSGPVFGDEMDSDPFDHIPWASRPSASSHPHSSIAEEDEKSKGESVFITPSENRMVAESPGTFSSSEEPWLQPEEQSEPRLQVDTTSSAVNDTRLLEVNTAPAETHQGHRRLSRPPLPPYCDTHPKLPLLKALHSRDLSKGVSEDSLPILVRPKTKLSHTAGSLVGKTKDGGTETGPEAQRREWGQRQESSMEKGKGKGRATEVFSSAREKPEGWGREFRVEWIRTDRLPFQHIRHLRNPWNHDREVKISRDGTELEPGVGQKLIDEWDKPGLVENSVKSSTNASGNAAWTRDQAAVPVSSTSATAPAQQTQTQEVRAGMGVSGNRGRLGGAGPL